MRSLGSGASALEPAPELLAQLNKILEQWKKDGTLEDVLDDWITVRKTTLEVVKPQ